jgi:hypothetical protein
LCGLSKVVTQTVWTGTHSILVSLLFHVYMCVCVCVCIYIYIYIYIYILTHTDTQTQTYIICMHELYALYDLTLCLIRTYIHDMTASRHIPVRGLRPGVLARPCRGGPWRPPQLRNGTWSLVYQLPPRCVCGGAVCMYARARVMFMIRE